MYYQNIKTILLIMMAAICFSACSTDVGGDEDKIKPSVIIDSISDTDDSDGEIIGTATIQWTTDEVNRSTVDIFLSGDAGETFETTIELNVPDTGEYVWDTNTVADCRACRLRIIPTDVVGNVGDPAESEEDFIINNVPQVLGAALYFDFGNDGVGKDDTISIPFDKNIDLNALVAGDTFFMPVLDDNIGAFSTMELGAAANEVIITINELVGINENLHLHIRGTFDATKTNRTAPSGLDILSGLAGEVIFSPETGRTAEPLGDGIDIAPTFRVQATPPGIAAAQTVANALVDLDDNGTLDAVVVNSNGTGGAPIQSVYSGDGDGTFSAFPAGVQQLGDSLVSINNAVAVGDIDGIDGPDIVIATGSPGAANNIVYYNNNTDGDFGIKASLSLGNSDTFGVTLGDIDDNGSLDLVTGNDGANRVWRNDGFGVLAEDGVPQTLGSSATTSIELADIDGDGDKDIITGNASDQANRVYTNNGFGEFSDSGQTLGSSSTLAIAVADVDGDGDRDIATGNDNNQANRIWLNDGNGVFTDSGQSLDTNRTKTVELVDIDADGDLDLITGSDDPNTLANKVWFNDSDGLFTDTGQTVSNDRSWSLAFGDLDGDQDLDMLEGVFNPPTANVVWLSSQRHAAQVDFIDSDQSLGTRDTRAVARGDVDGDGDLDVVSGNQNQGNRVWLNNINNTGGEEGSFTDSGQSLGSDATFAVALGDVDNDGDLDMITGNGGLTPEDNLVWRNDGNGVFTDSGQTLGTRGTGAIAIGDIDGVNGLDIIEGHANGPDHVWRNNGSGTFSEDGVPQLLGNGITVSLAMADIDGDTDLDLVQANTIGDNLIFLNDNLNPGDFIQDQAFSNANVTQAVTLGDIDGDGDPDLVEGNVGQNIVVWENDGSASNMFINPQNITNTDNVTSVALHDIDGDGDRDLIVAVFGLRNRLYLNNGKGGFSLYLVRPVGVAPDDENDTASIATGDFDGDGDTDMLTGNGNGQGNRLWLNDF